MPSSQNFKAEQFDCKGQCQSQTCKFCHLSQTLIPQSENISWVQIDDKIINNTLNEETQNKKEQLNKEQPEEDPKEEQINQQFADCSCCQGNVFGCQATLCQNLGYCHCYASHIQESEEDNVEEIFKDYEDMNDMEEFQDYLYEEQIQE